MDKCFFDKNKECHALACYDSKTKCECRDEKGLPLYAEMNQLIKFIIKNKKALEAVKV